MSELDEAGRALLALASDAHDPTDADRARVRAALAARLGAAAGLGFGTVAALGATAKAAAGLGAAGAGAAGGVSAVGGAGAAAGTALAAKLVVAVALTTAVGVGAGVKLARRAAEAPPAATSAAASATHVSRKVAVAAPATLPAPASPSLPGPAPAPTRTPAREPSAIRQLSPPEAPPAPPPDAPPAPPVAVAALTRPPAAELPAPIDTRRAIDPACAPAAPGSGSAVADEARLLQDGLRALRAGKPACALSLLDAHARQYPEGVLAEEREAERALALAALGRIQEARQAAAAFLRKHPGSPLGVRLRHHIPGQIPGIDGGGESRTP